MPTKAERHRARNIVVDRAWNFIHAPINDNANEYLQLHIAIQDLAELGLDVGGQPAVHHDAHSTSIEAADSLVGKLGPLQQRIWEEIKLAGGLTCDQVEVILGGKHQTISARINEMETNGWLVDSGTKRKTRSGRKARVLVVTAMSLREEGLS